MVAIPESGQLENTPLPNLLLELSRSRFDGNLRLSRQRHEKTFRFQRGAPISAESNVASETLGLQLLDSGQISRDDHHRVSSYVVERDVKEGVALLELGLLNPKELFVALKEQVRTRLQDCFGWPRGEYAIEIQQATTADAQPFRADVYPLIQEGIEIHWNAERVLADLAPHMNQTARRNRQLSRAQERLRSDDCVVALIDALDGTRTLWRALQSARTPRSMAAAWVLDGIGAIDYAAPKSANDAKREEDAPPEIEIVLTDADEVVDPAGAPGVAASGAEAADAPGMDEVLVLEISQKYVSLDDLDYYAMIGIPQDAPPAAIKRAYLDAAKRYHPDALARARLDGETRQKAGKVFAAIGKAHAVLADPKRRRSYDASLDSDETDLDAERLAAAETNYRKGEILMRQGNFRGALDFLRPAVELWPEDGTYQASLGWSLYKATPSDPVRAREHLERAYSLEPRDAEIAHRLSLVLKTLGEVAPAANLLAKARELDPDIG
jgi:tetratricopeptide (TPR) repeat protein